MAISKLIKYFKVAPTDGKKVEVSRVVMEGAKRGYLVAPEACTEDVLEFLEAETFNPNSTFYKTWKDVTDKDRFELFIDQILHYASTYGTNYEGEVYCPNGEPIEINYNTYEVIRAVSPKEMFDLCVGVLQSGIALAKDTLDSLISYVAYCVKEYHFPLDINSIQNRDAECLICDALGIMPTSGMGIIRYLFHQVFGNPMPIKSNAHLNALLGYRRRNGKQEPFADISKVDLTKLTDEQCIELSKVFYRYKKFLLGLKKNRKNAPVVNKVRRLATVHHKPMKIGYWENLLGMDEKVVLAKLPEEIAKLDNNFKITRLMQMIALRKIQNKEKLPRLFHIRNGRTWLDKNSIAPYAGCLETIFEALANKLIENLTTKRFDVRASGQVYVKYPKNLNLVCPVSEKKFFGNLPFGSSYDLADSNNYFGVYWRNEWGTKDFDLHFMGDNGENLGWCRDFYNEKKSLVFSGDMTNAEPEATEMYYAAGTSTVPNGNLSLNRYNGEAGSKYRIFFGQDKIANFGKNYMVDPNTIKVSEMAESTSKQQIVGRIQDMKMYFVIADQEERIVSMSNIDRNKAYLAQCISYLPLKPVLEAAGWLEYTDKQVEDGIEPDLDLTDLKKDTLINLFS